MLRRPFPLRHQPYSGCGLEESLFRGMGRGVEKSRDREEERQASNRGEKPRGGGRRREGERGQGYCQVTVGRSLEGMLTPRAQSERLHYF